MKRISYSFFCLLYTIYSFSQGVWTQKASFTGTARGDAFSFSIGTKGYIGGGEDVGGNYVNDFWEYDAINNAWTQKANLGGIARFQAVSFCIGMKGYMGTGTSNSGYCNDFWEYDSATDSWMQKASLPADKRTGAVGFSIGNNGYIGTGWGIDSVSLNNVNHNDFWKYDPATNSWSKQANVPGVRRGFAVGLSLLDKGYIGMGHDSSGNTYSDFWDYDTTLNAWTPKSNYPGGNRMDIDGGHFTIGNYGYIGTGSTNSIATSHNDFWKYNPANDSWTQIQNLPAQTRIGASGFSINNKGYIGLGFLFNPNINYLNDLWEYTDTTNGESVNEINFENYFSVYPNPTNGTVTLQYDLPKGEKEGEIILYNTQGAEIKRHKLDDAFKDLLLDNTQLPEGTYFYRLTTSKGSMGSMKMVVVK
jgi:N-acetylneuraminic acid mutarotase